MGKDGHLKTIDFFKQLEGVLDPQTVTRLKDEWNNPRPPNVSVPVLVTEADRVDSALTLLEIAEKYNPSGVNNDRMRRMGLEGRADYLLNFTNG